MQNVLIDKVLEPGVRVTVAMGTNRNLDAGNEWNYVCFLVLILLVFCWCIDVIFIVNVSISSFGP